MKEKGVIHLALPLVLIIVIIAGIILIASGVIKIPKLSLPFGQKQPKVELKSEYKNPFKKETQYVNPFETYKNPFVVNR